MCRKAEFFIAFVCAVRSGSVNGVDSFVEIFLGVM